MGTSTSLDPETLETKDDDVVDENVNVDENVVVDETVDLQFSDSDSEDPQPATEVGILECLASYETDVQEFLVSLKKLVETEPKPVVQVETAKTMTGGEGTGGVENNLNSNSSAALTFSWERESVGLFDEKYPGDRNILAFYLPPALQEPEWWEIIRGKNASEDFGTFQKFDRNDNAWVGLLHRCDMAKGLLYIREKDIPWSALKRASYTPPYFSETLAEENAGADWEVNSAWAVPRLSDVVEHMQQLEVLCSEQALQDPLAHAEGKSYHIHVVFRRPAMKKAVRLVWAGNMAALAFLLNDYGCLRMYQWGTIGKPIVGPFSQCWSDWLRIVLTFKRLRRGSDMPMTSGALEETQDGHNKGPVKWAATALRQTYKACPGGPLDPEILGFEFRAWKFIQEHLAHIGKVASLLDSVDLKNPDAMVSLGNNKPYALSALLQFQHARGALQLDEVFAGAPLARQFVIKVLRWSVDNSWFKLQECPMALDRILYPFLKWQLHPAVLTNDPNAGEEIVMATTLLLHQFELYAAVIAACDGEEAIPGRDFKGQFDDTLATFWEKGLSDRPDLAKLVQSGDVLPKTRPNDLKGPVGCLILVRKLLTTHPYKLLQNVVNDWAETTRIWRWL